MKKKNKKNFADRSWSPKCRATTFKDKRTKRKRTRQTQNSEAIKNGWNFHFNYYARFFIQHLHIAAKMAGRHSTAKMAVQKFLFFLSHYAWQPNCKRYNKGMMSNTTWQIAQHVRHLESELDALPSVSKNNAYACLLKKQIEVAKKSLDDEMEIDYDKSMSRCDWNKRNHPVTSGNFTPHL